MPLHRTTVTLPLPAGIRRPATLVLFALCAPLALAQGSGFASARSPLAPAPGDAKRFHAHFVAGFRKVALTLHQAAQAGRDGDFDKRDRLLDHIDTSPGLRELQAAERSLG